MRIFHILLLVVTLGGCSTHVAQMDSLKEPLVDAAYFYVPISADGHYDGRRQVGSGKLVAGQIDAALKTHVHNVLLGDREENLGTALTSAQQHQARYVMYASILDWQNDATQMADIKDKLAIKVEVVDVASRAVIDAAVLRNETGFFTTDKVASPQLLAPPLNRYIAALFDRSDDLNESLREPAPSPCSLISWKGICL